MKDVFLKEIFNLYATKAENNELKRFHLIKLKSLPAIYVYVNLSLSIFAVSHHRS